MDNWSLISNILGLAIGAGLNLYAAVLVTGLGLRYGWISNLPGELSLLAHPAVLVAAGVMYVAEFAADKVPFFTPVWDAIHTFIRPVGAALLALSATANLDPVVKAIAMLAAGTLALGTHSSKMGFRLMAHTTPEPVTHSAISVAEDFGVVVLLALAYQYPYVAIPVFLLIICTIAAFVPLLLRILRFLIAGAIGRVVAWLSALPSEEAPAWVPDRANSVRVFARGVKGVPRLANGWLHPHTGEFHFRRWGAKKVAEVGALEPDVNWGFVYNVVRSETGATFYVTKEWCHCIRTASSIS
ncbi:MAG: DUF4126 domain-containing protein [Acidobacteria bacterium]|nr:DUF4126 domain-containing protein [Acidobacteriota bacterium]